MLSVLLALCVILAAVVVRVTRKRARLPYPPGPQGKPLVGNAFEIPHDFAWLYYTELYEKYGMLKGLIED